MSGFIDYEAEFSAADSEYEYDVSSDMDDFIVEDDVYESPKKRRRKICISDGESDEQPACFVPTYNADTDIYTPGFIYNKAFFDEVDALVRLFFKY